MDVIHFTQGATDPLKGFDSAGARFVPLADGSGDTHVSCLHLERGGRITAPSITHAAAHCGAEAAERFRHRVMRGVEARVGLTACASRTAGGCGKNFLPSRFPASGRKPVVCRPGQSPPVACDGPCFSRPKRQNVLPPSKRESRAVSEHPLGCQRTPRRPAPRTVKSTAPTRNRSFASALSSGMRGLRRGAVGVNSHLTLGVPRIC
jgi:hypothetical protein